MNTQEVANRLVELCRSGKYDEAQNELYSQDAISIEPEGGPWQARVEGMEGIKQKGQQWAEMAEEVHSAETSDPIVAGDFFSVIMKNDVTFKGMGRAQIEEVAVFGVKDGKIVSEQFFYTPMG